MCRTFDQVCKCSQIKVITYNKCSQITGDRQDIGIISIMKNSSYYIFNGPLTLRLQ